MKTFLLLSDTNVGLIIAGIISVVTLLVSLVIIPFLNKIVETHVKTLHVQMNGMKDELVRTTSALANALGNREGRAELTQEQKDGNGDSVQVEINRQEIEKLKGKLPAPVDVVVTKNLDK